MKQTVVQRDNRAADNWHRNNSYLLGHTARRSMIPIPEPLLVTLASFDHEAARSMFTKKFENGFYVTGLNHELNANDPRPICIVLEPFHDKDFENGVDYQFGYTKDDCFNLSKSITTKSRKYRGPADGWIKVEDIDNRFRAWDTRLLLLSCCYGTKPRIELMITKNTQYRARSELDVIVLK
eukprot:6480182-Amphidinium_carterae.1